MNDPDITLATTTPRPSVTVKPARQIYHQREVVMSKRLEEIEPLTLTSGF